MPVYRTSRRGHARVRTLSAREIADRLDDRFSLLTGGNRDVLPRQQTLLATVAWSHDLLGQPERVLFRRLSVFAGGWLLADAENVCSVDGEQETAGRRHFSNFLALAERAHDQKLASGSDAGMTALASQLESLGFIEWEAGDHQAATRHLRRSLAMHQAHGGSPVPHFQRMTEAVRARAEQRVDPRTAVEAWNDGLQMTTDEAVAYARQST